MHKGLNKELEKNFSNIRFTDRPLIETTKISDPNWISGFSSGESCFDVKIIESIRYTVGYTVQIRFRITQHIRDIALLALILSYLNCGTLQFSRNTVDFSVTNYKDIINIIIPYFNKYPILGIKNKDFEDFCKVAKLMQGKAHLTEEGIIQIRQIKAEMNKGRLMQ